MTLRFNPLVFFALFPSFAVLVAQGAAAGEPANATPVAVLELFTSQGCSSCPAADALMHDYVDRPDVVALTLPVDYWDYLGWKDTLASPKFTERQRAYSKARGDGRIYTPQMVVNGMVDTIGSHQGDIDRAITRSREIMMDKRISADVSSDGAVVTIAIGPGREANAGLSGTVWLAVVKPVVEVEIQRGENKGRKAKYYNVVRDLMPVGSWSGQSTTIKLEQSSVRPDSKDRCAVLVQKGSTGPIVGAAWMTTPSY